MIITETARGDDFLKRCAELKAQGRVLLRMKSERLGEYTFEHDDAARYEKGYEGEQPELAIEVPAKKISKPSFG